MVRVEMARRGMADAVLVDPSGISLAVRLTPKASKTCLGDIVSMPDGDALSIRVSAPPVEGAANAAVCAYLAKQLGVRKSDVTIRSGKAARRKIVRISGDGPLLAARLDGLMI